MGRGYRHGHFNVEASDVDDSTAEIPGDESVLRASVALLNRLGKKNKQKGGYIKNQNRKAHEAKRQGQPPGVQVGTLKPNPRIGRSKVDDQADCSCGVTFRRGSPAHQAHIEHFPQLCRKRAGC